ncbi:NAD-dependent epimerase/dehydratase family protein [Muricauda sp. JGD-17]|uniref:NAD-dependent epimerase/dehydratase family protein n=1 Tax=Flagellimonas ochracea TaxID=2696472 RepID=A0A964TAF1_9FLAO|nr:NAD-dependent epimerase [Allomuricauda ochracea]NAY91217.1 NAD-dependent epimerase/dehydratase family protein [Allomuricauda ochracea]
MKILVTGAAGFIGYHISKKLLAKGHSVVGLDNINDYYDVGLKLSRLEHLGIGPGDAQIFNKTASSNLFERFRFVRMNLEDRNHLPELFANEKFHVVCNLAAQAGVRYSLENPEAYIDSNIVGFLNILECCRNHNIEHLVYASSSSVYGNSNDVPFKTSQNVDHPISLYAATKKSNELMAYTYSHLYGFRTTGLRFFTVYGPWGRPDMAMFLFTKAILEGKSINVFNNGEMERDFTYIDDIVEGVLRVLKDDYTSSYNISKKYKVYNIGNSNSVKLLNFIHALEKELKRTAKKNMLPLQPGDVLRTWADVSDLVRDYDYTPNTGVQDGIHHFVEWFRNYYKV